MSDPNAKRWQQSFSGKVVHPQALAVDEVNRADIGHALAQKIRFNGQCTVMGYTVAQHTVLGAQAILDAGGSKLEALAFLLHEVSEVYLPDIPSPVKLLTYVSLDNVIIPWHEFEEQHAMTILTAIGHPEVIPLLATTPIHEMDLRMLVTEKRDLMGKEPQPWGFKQEPLTEKIVDIWEPIWAEQRWNWMYEKLTGEAPL